MSVDTQKEYSEAKFILNCNRTGLPATLDRVVAVAGQVIGARVESNGGELGWSLTSTAVFGGRPATLEPFKGKGASGSCVSTSSTCSGQYNYVCVTKTNNETQRHTPRVRERERERGDTD